jgi:hypothetical protein
MGLYYAYEKCSMLCVIERVGQELLYKICTPLHLLKLLDKIKCKWGNQTKKITQRVEEHNEGVL